MLDLELHALMIFVPDLEVAKRFYRDTLGMRLGSEQGVRLLHEEPARNEWGRYAAFADPFGNVHEVFEARPG